MTMQNIEFRVLRCIRKRPRQNRNDVHTCIVDVPQYRTRLAAGAATEWQDFEFVLDEPLKVKP